MERLLTTMPSFNTSPRMRSVPQSGFSCEILPMSAFSSALRRGRPSRVRDFQVNRAANPSGASAGPSPASPDEGAGASHQARDGEARPKERDRGPEGGDAGWSATRPEADGGGQGSRAQDPVAIERQRRTYEAHGEVIRASARIATK